MMPLEEFIAKENWNFAGNRFGYIHDEEVQYNYNTKAALSFFDKLKLNGFTELMVMDIDSYTDMNADCTRELTVFQSDTICFMMPEWDNVEELGRLMDIWTAVRPDSQREINHLFPERERETWLLWWD